MHACEQDIVADFTLVSYAKVTSVRYDDLPALELLSMASNTLFLGDPLVDSQHLIGAAAEWVKASDGVAIGFHQTRAAHTRWMREEKSGVAATGHGPGPGHIEVLYRKVHGAWKWSGITTHMRWNGHEWENVFLGVHGKKVGVQK